MSEYMGFMVEGPKGSRFQAVRLRLFAGRPKDEVLPEETYRVATQAVTAEGFVVAEDPICDELMTRAELEEALALSRADGWEVHPCDETERVRASFLPIAPTDTAGLVARRREARREARA